MTGPFGLVSDCEGGLPRPHTVWEKQSPLWPIQQRGQPQMVHGKDWLFLFISCEGKTGQRREGESKVLSCQGTQCICCPLKVLLTLGTTLTLVVFCKQDKYKQLDESLFCMLLSRRWMYNLFGWWSVSSPWQSSKPITKLTRSLVAP